MYIPDLIKDPVLKQEYVDALAKKKQASKWWGVQRDLRTMEENMPRKIDKRIAYMYSQKPDDVDELKQILTDNKISPETSHRILSAVAVARGEPVPERVTPEPDPTPAPKVEAISDEEKAKPEPSEAPNPILIALGTILLLALIFWILRTRKK